MPQHWTRNIAHVVRRGEITTANCSQRFRTQQQRHRSARTRSIMNKRMSPSSPHQIDGVMLHARLHTRGDHFVTAASDRSRIAERLNVHVSKPARVETRIPVCYDLTF